MIAYLFRRLQIVAMADPTAVLFEMVPVLASRVSKVDPWPAKMEPVAGSKSRA